MREKQSFRRVDFQRRVFKELRTDYHSGTLPVVTRATSLFSLGPAVDVVVVLARTIFGHRRHDLRRHVLHGIDDDFPDGTVIFDDQRL